MNREERIKEARRRAAARAPERAAEEAEWAEQLQSRMKEVGPTEAQRMVSAAEISGDVDYLGPLKTPREWDQAVNIARLAALGAARSERLITYGEIKLAVFEELGLLVGYSMFAELVVSVNQQSDGVLLSSIIVHAEDQKPGDGFLPYAREQGFEEPLESLQRHVFEHFASG